MKTMDPIGPAFSAILDQPVENQLIFFYPIFMGTAGRKLDIRDLTPLAGVVGSGVLLLGWIITGIAYRGRAGELFSPLNHFISELGQTGVSRLSTLFNLCMIAGGLLLIVFMLALGLYIDKIPGYIACAVGILAAISAILVGFFPINHGSVHKTVSIFFFWGALVAIIIFNLTIATDSKRRISRWLVVPGFISFALFTLLILALRASPTPTAVLDPGLAVRPTVWMIAILEWLAVLSLIACVLSFSLYMYRARSAAYRVPSNVVNR
jgi:hypothetical membrane protein